MKSDYDRYFTACAPKNCHYSYAERANMAYAVATVLSLYGGLTVVLRWLLPRLVKVGHLIFDYIHKKRQNSIMPVDSD